MSNIVPLANLTDLASIAMDKGLVRYFNPLLSDKSINTLQWRTLNWLELCVLEDKCHALLLFEHDEAAFLTESRSTRKWDTAKHPYWLVFEAEQQIRIRSEQYTVANHLIDIDNTGSIVQLNMGLGKTRVVLPMIILYFCFEKNHVKHTPRLCILSTLLDEACEYYQKVLCASTIGRRLFLCPFRRDVELTPDRIQLMLDMISHCEIQNGFIVLAPEHRMSLELKVKELEISNEQITCQSLKEVQSRKYFDIFDEVDEILHHRFQLVYSMGNPSPLPEGNRRWEVSAGLLEVLQKGKINSITFMDDSKYPEKFKEYILADDIDALSFRNQLANCLLEKPPLPLDWLSLLLKTEQKQVVHKVITDHKSDPTILNLRAEEHMQDILMLRGLLAEDIFLHCLHKRHRVDYGINPKGRKRLSVPFRGADLPSQRAEFSHPDCAIVMTHLSYFYTGLTIEQIKSTFDILQNLGMGAKESIYDAWFAQSKTKIQEGNFDGYHMNPLTIHFWLRSCIFSTELDSYPSRLSSNAWHLANNEDGMTIGFSGTNDNHFLIPLQVQQYLPWETKDIEWRKLLATNGKMLDVILEKCKECKHFGSGTRDLRNFLLDYFKKGRIAHALIDAGAILAGICIRVFAQFLLTECFTDRRSELKGVTYFENDEWKVMDLSGEIMSKNSSPLHERDTFVIFDEPRCRGVDMKLREDALAFISIGKEMRKDKFMQAAGRMRQLERQQSLLIIGERNIFSDISRNTNANNTNVDGAINVGTKDVLNWIMKNTANAMIKGISQWAENGLFFASESEAKHAVLDDRNNLDALYGTPSETKRTFRCCYQM
jgi:Protein of unknown function (DUF3645)./Protein of unknown function (DUF3638).